MKSINNIKEENNKIRIIKFVQDNVEVIWWKRIVI